MSRSWSSAHDWKSCKGQKLFESSNLSISAKKNRSPTIGGGSVFYLWLERFEQGTSEARETCRGHVSVPACVPARCPRRANLSISAKKNRSPTIGGGSVFYLWLERFEQGTSEARETCRGHVSVPACVPARCPRRANLSISAKQNPVRLDGVFIISCFPCPSRTGGRAPRPANGPARSASIPPSAGSGDRPCARSARRARAP